MSSACLFKADEDNVLISEHCFTMQLMILHMAVDSPSKFSWTMSNYALLDVLQ